MYRYVEEAIRAMFIKRAVLKKVRMVAYWRKWAAKRGAAARHIGEEMRALLASRKTRRCLRAWSELVWERLAHRARDDTVGGLYKL
jgi:hypothetical protein